LSTPLPSQFGKAELEKFRRNPIPAGYKIERKSDHGSGRLGWGALKADLAKGQTLYIHQHSEQCVWGLETAAEPTLVLLQRNRLRVEALSTDLGFVRPGEIQVFIRQGREPEPQALIRSKHGGEKPAQPAAIAQGTGPRTELSQQLMLLLHGPDGF
jgi:glucose dehydrogenase